MSVLVLALSLASCLTVPSLGLSYLNCKRCLVTPSELHSLLEVSGGAAEWNDGCEGAL